MAQATSLSFSWHLLRLFTYHSFAWGLLILGALVWPVTSAAESDVPCEAEPTDMTIAYGALIDCAIDPLGDTDVFRFQGASGEVVVVQVVMDIFRLGSDFNSSLELLDPDGQSVDLVTGFSTAQVRATLTKSGTHTLLVKERDDDETGPFNLALERIVPPTPGAPRVLIGSVASGVIDEEGDLDLYRFEASSGEAITVRAATDLSGESEIEVFDPDGFSLGSDSALGDPTARVDVMLAKTGTYTVLAKDLDDDDSGGETFYSLALQRVSECRGTSERDLSSQTVSTSEVVEACDSISAGDGYEVGSSGDVTFLAGNEIVLRDGFEVEEGASFTAGAPAWGAPIGYGDALERLLGAAEMQVFHFAGQAGETIVTQVVSPGFADARVEVYDPDGFQAGRTLSKTGTHSILVKEAGADDSGEFTVVLERLSPPSPAARSLCFGCTLNGALDPRGDLDVFTFEATGGETISAELSMPNIAEPELLLYDPNGFWIAIDRSTGTASIDTVLTQPGTHSLLVDEHDGRSSPYEVGLRCVADCGP